MELRHLRYFVAAAEVGSLTVAARKLHTSQPSLSPQIRDLEGNVGAQLLVRSARGIELTAAGRAFLEHARSAMSQVGAAAWSCAPGRVRRIILHSRHLGAHGMGYNNQSLNSLSQKLTRADIPTLIDLLADKDLPVGVQFALASQCRAAIIPVREATAQHKMSFLDAEDAMRLIEGFAACTPETRQSPSAMRSQIHSLSEAEQRRLEEEAKDKAADDARIQRNAVKMMDPKQAKELTRQEREEV